MIHSRLPLLLAALLLATPVLAQGPSSSPPTDQRLDEVEKKLDAAIAEIERMKLSGTAAADTTPAMMSRHGFGPAASRVYGVASGPSIGGYGEALYESPSQALPRVDLLRAVFYIGHKFTPNLLFNSEIEFEHAGVRDEAVAEVNPLTGEGTAELTGEVVMEFAYLDWMARPSLGVRAGKVLVPMGLVNEQHEPPVFIGARRPETERVIIPSTWAAVGAGLYGGTPGGLEWRAYLMEGLDGAHFSASGGIRGGRQAGSQAVVTHPALAARADWKGTPGLLVGLAGYTGDSWQQADPAGVDLSARVSMSDLHGTYRWRGLEVRGLYAMGTLDQAGELSDQLGLTGADRLGERFWGGYAEAAWDVAPTLWPGSSWNLLPYLRTEKVDTQDEVPGGVESPALERSILTFGVAVKPHPNVVIKTDRESFSDAGGGDASRWNVALGWLF